MAHASPVLERSMVNHYQILSQLASGGMGVVYKAFDTQLERTVALKFLTPDPDCTVADREQLLREARAAANLDHRYIANIHAVEETADGQLFIVMAFYEGESLASKMATAPIAKEEALRILHEIGEGLAHAHSHDVIHRDIKPSNIILTPEGEVKIVDFGLARFTRSDAATQSLNIAGTLMYMSPELLSGFAVDARSDIWSLGVIAYQLLTHHAPFKERNPAAMVNAILHSAPAPMIGVPDDLQLIVHRALAKNTLERYQSCEELLRDLDAIASNSGTRSLRQAQHHELLSDISAYFHNPRRALFLAVIVVLAFTVSYRAIVYLKTSHPPQQVAASTSTPVAYEWYLRGVELLQKRYKPGAISSAISAFERATQSDPKFALAYVGLAEANWERYRETNDPKLIEVAESNTRKALALNDQLPGPHVILGRIQAATSHQEIAIQEFQRALDLEPMNPSALLGLGNTYAKVHREREAEELMKKVISLRPEDWRAYSDLGSLYYSLHRFREAAEMFVAEIELAPDNATAHSSLGTSLLALQKIPEAEAEFKKAVSIAPDYIGYSNLAVIYFGQKRYEEAAAMLEKASEINAMDYRVWSNLALTLELIGHKERASQAQDREFQLLQNIVANQMNDPNVHSHLAMQYAARRLNKKAKLQIEAALALAPANADVNTSAGITYETLGDRTQALEYLSNAIKYGATLEDLRIEPALRSIFADPKLRQSLEQTTTAKQ